MACRGFTVTVGVAVGVGLTAFPLFNGYFVFFCRVSEWAGGGLTRPLLIFVKADATFLRFFLSCFVERESQIQLLSWTDTWVMLTEKQ